MNDASGTLMVHQVCRSLGLALLFALAGGNLHDADGVADQE
jgi:hypothetical protein